MVPDDSQWGDCVMDWVSLSPRARWLFYLQAFSRLLMWWLPVTAGMVAVAITTVATPLQGAIGGALWLFWLFLLAVWMPTLKWQRYRYQVRDDDVVIQHGVIVRVRSAIPTCRIQHVDLRQGPIEQYFGLARIRIHTASGVGADGLIPGLELSVAEGLRDRLVQVKGDDGV